MPYNDTTPTFRGKPVLIDYDPSIKRWRLVAAGMAGAISGAESSGASQDAMLIRIHEVVSDYGLVAQLGEVTDDVIRIRVTKG